MGFLSAGNREFHAAVTRTGAHLKTSRLRRLEAALLAVQTNAGDTVRLKYLYKRLYRWMEENPAEFRTRGALATKLAYQIEQRAGKINANIIVEQAEFTRVRGLRGAPVWTPLPELTPAIQAHVAAWGAISITDVPQAGGGYAYTAGNAFSEADRNGAIAEEGNHPNIQLRSNYWIRLGKRVMTPQLDGICYGRCFSCAAAVIYELVRDPAFDDYMIEHVGATANDHHLVVVGRKTATGVDASRLNINLPDWQSTSIVIDVWEANLPPIGVMFMIATANAYAPGGNLRWFCAYPPENRLADRGFANGLPVTARYAIVPGMQAAAQAELRNAGRPSRNVPAAGGRWVVQEQRDDGSWRTL
jgi:hypothetical protein